jgi:pimeloyl-ACP methyl ester carboxylesterase
MGSVKRNSSARIAATCAIVAGSLVICIAAKSYSIFASSSSSGPAKAGLEMLRAKRIDEAKFGRAWDEGFDYRSLRAAYRLPVFVVQGDLDIDAPVELSRAWFDRIGAPAKAFTVVPGAGTHALQTDPDSYLAVLRDQVRPWAVSGG